MPALVVWGPKEKEKRPCSLGQGPAPLFPKNRSPFRGRSKEIPFRKQMEMVSPTVLLVAVRIYLTEAI